jgi:hypothetical protein
MGILSGLMGNATEIDIQNVEKEFEKLLVDGEKIEKAYKVLRDLFVFTNKRLVLVNKQGVTGKKVEYHSIPYYSISHFSIESSGKFDLDAELKLWVKGMDLPIEKKFKKDNNIYDIQKSLAKYLLE